MGLFDNLKEFAGNAAGKIKDVAGDAADKAKDMAETGKQKMKIAEAEKNIKDVYTAIGKDLFEKFQELSYGFYSHNKIPKSFVT